MNYSTFLPADVAFTGSDAALASFIVPSADPAGRTKTSTDWCFDALAADGYPAGALPANGSALPAAGLINVANDSPLALPASVRGAVTATAAGAAPAVAVSAAGASGIVMTGQRGLRIHKAGIADTAASNPVAEGFLDHLVIIWAKITANSGGRLYSVTNGSDQGPSYWYVNSDGRIIDVNYGNRDIAGGAAFGTMRQYAQHLAYSVAADTITVTNYCDGQVTGAGLVAAAKPSQQAAYDQSSMTTEIGSYSNATIARAERLFTGIAGHVVDPTMHVANDWAANRARLAGR